MQLGGQLDLFDGLCCHPYDRGCGLESVWTRVTVDRNLVGASLTLLEFAQLAQGAARFRCRRVSVSLPRLRFGL